MKLLPLDVCRIIWNLCGNDAIFLNKELITVISELKSKIRNDPLIIKYRLVKLRELASDWGSSRPSYRRPSLVVDKAYKTIALNGNLPLGKILNKNNILPSTILSDRLIPCSTCCYYDDLGRPDYRRTRVIYWELYDILCDNIKKAELYMQLFPYKGECTNLSRYSKRAFGKI